ncbi:hypothetical protein ACLOJK_022464 [Asimina triloba]
MASGYGTPSSPTNCRRNLVPATHDRPIRSGQEDGSPHLLQDPVNFIDVGHFQAIQVMTAVIFSTRRQQASAHLHSPKSRSIHRQQQDAHIVQDGQRVLHCSSSDHDRQHPSRSRQAASQIQIWAATSMAHHEPPQSLGRPNTAAMAISKPKSNSASSRRDGNSRLEAMGGQINDVLATIE